MHGTHVVHLLLAVLAACSIAHADPSTGAPSAGTGTRAEEPPRVRAARRNKQSTVVEMLRAQGVSAAPTAVYLRAFKREQTLELWASDGGPLRLIRRYPICASSGGPGPKTREGDGQVPEGFYAVDALQPASQFHLALHLNYPNVADRRRGAAVSPRVPLGGDIMVHGNCVTIGCIPIQDGPIEEVYLVVGDALARGGQVPIDIYPGRLDDAGLVELMRAPVDDEVRRFWRGLAPRYRRFEQTHRLPPYHVGAAGEYVVD